MSDKIEKEYIYISTPIGTRILKSSYEYTDTIRQIEYNKYKKFISTQDTYWIEHIPIKKPFIISKRHHDIYNISLEFLELVYREINTSYEDYDNYEPLMIDKFLYDKFKDNNEAISDFLTGNDYLITLVLYGTSDLLYNSKADCFEEIEIIDNNDNNNNDDIYTYKFQVITSILLLDYDGACSCSNSIVKKIMDKLLTYINYSYDKGKYYSRLLDIDYIDDDRDYYYRCYEDYYGSDILFSSFIYISYEYSVYRLPHKSYDHMYYSQSKIYSMFTSKYYFTKKFKDIATNMTKENFMNLIPNVDLCRDILCINLDDGIVPIYCNSSCRPACLNPSISENKYYKTKLLKIPIILLLINVLLDYIVYNPNRDSPYRLTRDKLLLIFTDIYHNMQFPQEKIDQYIC